MKLTLAVAAIVAAPAAADTFACDPWSAPQYREHGPLAVQASAGGVVWSNETRIITAEPVVNAPWGAVFYSADDQRLYIVSRGWSDAWDRPFTLRRIATSERLPDDRTRCTPTR